MIARRYTPVRIVLVAMFLCGIASAQVTLDFWSWRVEDRWAYEEIIAGYVEDHPGVRINYNAFESTTYDTILTTAFTAGEAPDIIHVRAYGNFETYAAPGYLMRLDDKVDALENFPDLALNGERLREDGNVYAVPFASQTLIVYYNTDIFDELGLAPPETWDEFLAAAKTIEDAGYIALANGTATASEAEIFTGVFAPNFYGADFFDQVVAGETTFEDPRFIQALEKVSELTEYMAPQFSGVDRATAQNLFLNELAAMYAGGSWEIANFRNQNPDLAFDVMAPPPESADDTPLVSWFLDGGYAVSADTNHPEESIEFVTFLASPEFGQQLTDKLANVSPIPGVVSDDPLLKKVTEFNQNSTPYIMLVGFRYEAPTGSVLMQQRLPGMYAGSMSPEQLAKEVTEGITQYYEPFQQR
ncbi:MAG: extracellular solute-binding protein [Trueperaceae bacterium]